MGSSADGLPPQGVGDWDITARDLGKGWWQPRAFLEKVEQRLSTSLYKDERGTQSTTVRSTSGNGKAQHQLTVKRTGSDF